MQQLSVADCQMTALIRPKIKGIVRIIEKDNKLLENVSFTFVLIQYIYFHLADPLQST